VVVFIPLAFLEGITGVFFRALALTMVVALVTSLALALTLTPSLAAWLTRDRQRSNESGAPETGDGFILRRIVRLYEMSVRFALRHRWMALSGSGLVLGAGILLYGKLESDFLPPMDEGGFVIDYFTPHGTSLAETNRQLLQAEEILRATVEVESYSRRTGARLALAIAEPNTGDFLVKLKPDRQRHTQDVIAELRAKFHVAVPGVEWDFPGILSDLIGDLTWSPKPIEVKLFSTDVELLKRKGPELAEQLKAVKGVVDVFDGLVFTGPTLSLKVRSLTAERFGLTAGDIAGAVNTAMLGQVASSVLEGDRVVSIRVRVDCWRQSRQALASRRCNRDTGTARNASRRSQAGYCGDGAPGGSRSRQRHGRDPDQAGGRWGSLSRNDRVRRPLSAAAGILS
jgi:multidrug efflux pump subunit AcrB